ncbi:hypothetical protein [Chryseobacterium sp. Mn2064]|uniref:hypothetical protein n=1 Tax=Chryseobacterium sp. Mn2064 TaxID=3395263 RepID=UPI003BEC96DE
MRKKLLLVAVLAANLYYAQQDGRVGINTTTPTTTLDVNGKTDGSGVSLATDATGLQAPRLTRAELTAKGELLYTLKQKGALVYITNVTGGNTSGQRVNVTTEGYYYFDGASWVKITTGASSGVATADNGLTMSTASNTQLGGTLSKNTDVALGNFHMTFSGTGTGNVGIGLTSPAQKLDVNGNVRFRGVPVVDGTTVTAATTDKMMVLAADGTGKLYPLPATVKKVSPEQTGNFTFTAADDWDVILYNKASGANAVLTLPVVDVAPGKTVYVTNTGSGAIDVPSSILRGAPPSPNISAGNSVTFVFLGPNGNNKWAQVSGF